MRFSSEALARQVARTSGMAVAVWPGVFACALMAIAALFVSQQYGAPAFLMALLFGMAMTFLNDPGSRSQAGLAFCSSIVLRGSVALLGLRISFDTVVALGWGPVMLVILCSLLTLACGVILSARLGRSWYFGALTGGAVAICGASAAAAIAAVLPQTETSARNLGVTVLSVTLLSTLAMVLYPVLVGQWGLDDTAAGIFLGATIHDVAQVVGAGFSVSDNAGETATLVKLIRVALLGPVVVCLALFIRWRAAPVQGDTPPPILPGFVVVFIALAALNSFEALDDGIVRAANGLCYFGLLIAIAAIGARTSLRDSRAIGGQALFQIVTLSAILGALVSFGIGLLSLVE
jgi:uncharacterized integral membrane protein (TIGR00698 family)